MPGRSRSHDEYHIASAAFALLSLSTSDDVFTSDSKLSHRNRRISEVRQKMTCPTCSGQSIQRKNSQLYHVKLIKSHLVEDPNAQLYQVDVRGTFTDFLSARAAASTIIDLPLELFESYESKHDFPESKKWPHADDVYVHAVAQTGETITVSIDKEPNHSDLVGNSHGEVCSILFYAIQQVIHYSENRSGLVREASVQGTYRTRVAAKKCAEEVLLGEAGSPQDFDEYQDYGELDTSPWGEDVVIRAVSSNGDNYIMSVVQRERENKACI